MRASLVALVLVACSTSAPPPMVPPAPPAPPPASPPPAPPPPVAPMLDKRISAALDRVSSSEIERDLRAIAIPRHHAADPAGLAFVASLIQRESSAAGYAVRREPVTHAGATADNIVAERPGRDKNVVVVCAHYDAVPNGPGADDNGSGVAGMLAIARAVAAVPTNATIRFIAFAFEEEGLVGSLAHVKLLDEAERARITGVLDLEMIGFTSESQHFPPGVEAFSDEPIPTRGDFLGAVGLSGDARLMDIVRAAKPYVPDLPVATLAVPKLAVAIMPDLARSDHSPFWLAGIPAVMITDTANFRNPHYHKRSDSLDTIDFTFATKASKLVAAATLIAAEPLAK